MWRRRIPGDGGALGALASWLEACERGMDAETREEIWKLAGDRGLAELAATLHKASSQEAIRAAAALLAANEGGCACSGGQPPEPTQVGEAAERLAKTALAPLTRNAVLRSRLEAL